MGAGSRSPFGALLRTIRMDRGLSQNDLARVITARVREEPSVANFGTLSSRTIARLEQPCVSPADFVRPRPNTVRLLAAALDMAPESAESRALFEAAQATRDPARVTSITAGTEPRHPDPAFIVAGRESQLATLVRAWHRARLGDATVCAVFGTSGVGKSHLIEQAVLSMLQTTSDTPMVAWGACAPGIERNPQWQPLGTAFESLLGFASPNDVTPHASDSMAPVQLSSEQQMQILEILIDDAPTVMQTMIDQHALQHRLVSIGAAGVKMTLQLSSAARDAAQDIDTIVPNELRTAMRRLTANRPLVLILDDIHWASDRFLEGLINLLHMPRTATLHLLIILSFRPTPPQGEDSETVSRASLFRDLLSQSHLYKVDLDSTVGSAASRQFIDEMAIAMGVEDSQRPGIVDQLFRLTGGHALFVIELLRLITDPATKTDLERLGDLPLPERVTAIMADRFAQVPQALQRTLEFCAVQGFTFDLETIAIAHDLAPDELSIALDRDLGDYFRLVAPGPVVSMGLTKLHQYHFVHSLFHSHVYDHIPRLRRERMHADIARAMVSSSTTHSPAHAHEIAYHFGQAHQLQEAARWAYPAATQASERFDVETAEAWLEQAAAEARLRGNLNDEGNARNAIMGMQRVRSEYDAALANGESILRDFDEDQFPAVVAQTHHLISEVLFDTGKNEPAITAVRRAITLYDQLDDPINRCQARSMLSHIYYRIGAYDKALAESRLALSEARRVERSAVIGEALLSIGNCQTDLGQYASAVRNYREARSFYQRAGNRRGELITTVNTALTSILDGDPQAGYDLLTEPSTIRSIASYALLHTHQQHYVGLARELMGQFEPAREAFEWSFQERIKIGTHSLAIDSKCGILRCAIALNDASDRIRPLIDEIEDLLRASSLDGIEDPVLVLESMSSAYQHIGDVEQAHAHLQRAASLIRDRAANLSDPSAKEHYLHGITRHQDILAAIDAHDRKQNGPRT